MRDRLYQMLVNRVPGIRDRYLEKRKQKNGMHRAEALLYLLWLNIQYYLLFRRSLGRWSPYPFYEEKTLYAAGSESSLWSRGSPEALAAKLMAYDIISFDVFDTLLFRPFSNPTHVFYLAGIRLQYPDFTRIRIESEQQARDKKRRESGTSEVTLEEIWDAMEAETGIPKETGMRVEWECEKRCCYGNPYMLPIVKELQRNGKRLIAASDMYLGKDQIRDLLTTCGYGEFEEYFVSCDYEKSKGEGSLYEVIRETMGRTMTYAHVGDNRQSDGKQARRHHFEAFWYPNVNEAGRPFRPEDMSALTGSLYRGIVNGHIHSGHSIYSREYEYGFIYGGLFVAGYCRFIHGYVKAHGIQKILFLSRDGAVLLQAYRQMYPEERGNTEYAYWSRLAAVKLTARYYRYDYLRRFLYHKVNQHYTLREILGGMELSHMLDSLCQRIKEEPDSELTNRNVENVKRYIVDTWDQVLAHYEEQVAAGGEYYRTLLQGCHTAAAVDIGWAGSGAVMLDCAVNRLWGLPCCITGIIAGTTAGRSPEADAGEPFMLSGQLVSYLYSQRENRDLWKYHDPAQNHNLYWELLLDAPEGSLKGFYPGKEGRWECRFKENWTDGERIREIHRGILDFVGQWLETERKLGLTLPISGRDAYAPMLCAEGERNRAFMAGLEELLDEIHIG
ncbi:hypothetical protein [Bianquea renquensis]|uniref:Uncharacterized protein n=1 Tax=Bianquea renquensis TaxID=2763661 RepID=A0A926DVQ4_9FIRM|nr:hypothetical protein [Bianquea renquensis]MBC8544961.1 hypothetical protein [Bianquea renquensis]